MKKIGFLIFCGLLLSGCKQDINPEALQTYNDRLMTLQEESVDVLQNYYQSLESGYDGTNIQQLYDHAVSSLSGLKEETQKVFVPNEETELKTAVLSYISGLQSSFETNEKPIAQLLTSFSGGASDFYSENTGIFSSYAMNLAHDLALLDKNLTESHQDFQKKYKTIFSPTKK